MAVHVTSHPGAQLPRWLTLLTALPVVLVAFAMLAARAERRDERLLIELRSATEAVEMSGGARDFAELDAPLRRANVAFEAVAEAHGEATRHSPYGQEVARLLARQAPPTPNDVAQLREAMLSLAWDVSEIGAARERVTTLALLVGLLCTLLVAARAVTLAEHIRKVEAGLRESEARFRRLSEFAFEGIAISEAGVIIDANDALGQILGRTREEMVGTLSIDFLDPSERERVAAIIAASSQPSANTRISQADGMWECLVAVGLDNGVKYETRIRRSDGRVVPVEVRARTEVFSGRTARVTVLRDISERKTLEAQRDRETEEFRNLSMVDDLTGLHNRRAFLALAEQALRQGEGPRGRAVLLFCDVDQLKPINDQHGHDEGDRVLRDVAVLLRDLFRDRDIVARLGGDEFVVLTTDVPEGAEVQIRKRFADALARFNSQPGRRYPLSISVGIAVHDTSRPRSADELLAEGDAHMYVEKRANREKREAGVVG